VVGQNTTTEKERGEKKIKLKLYNILIYLNTILYNFGVIKQSYTFLLKYFFGGYIIG